MTIKWDTAAVRERVHKAAFRGLVRATEMVRNEAISLIQNGQKTGRIYRRHGVVHQASAPGEAPASDTGALVNSIVTEYNYAELTGIVRAKLQYGNFLEYGTQTIEPRPFMRPALATVRSAGRKIISEEIARELARK